jgi:oligoendopeptidase F
VRPERVSRRRLRSDDIEAMTQATAARYFARLQRDPAFRARYLALLGHGYDAPPDALLAQVVDIKLFDGGALVRNAAQVLESWLRELETLYRDAGAR